MIFSHQLYENLVKAADKQLPFLATHTAQKNYAELLDAIQAMCGVYDAQHVTAGDRIGLWTEDPFMHAVTSLSGLLSGITIVIIPPRASTENTIAYAHSIDCKLVIYDDTVGCWLQTAKQSRMSKFFFNTKKYLLPELLTTTERAPPKYKTQNNATSFVVFSSGTTGQQKGIRWSYQALSAHLETNRQLFDYKAGLSICNGLSLEHSDGFFNSYLVCAWTGMLWIRPDKFSFAQIPRWNELMLKHQADIFIGVPSMLEILLYAESRCEEDQTFTAFRQLKFILSVAEKLKQSTWHELQKKCVPVGNIYGLSETVNGGIYALPGDAESFNTVGKPIDIEVKIVNADGNEVPDEEMGILSLKGLSLFDGYEMEQSFETVKLSHGWFLTSDYAKKLKNGRFQILGRVNESRNVGGILVHPNEVDAVIQSLPNVISSKSIFIVNDQGLQEQQLVSFVTVNRALSEEFIKTEIAKHLEQQKIPREILILDKLPVSVAGKIDTFSLSKQYFEMKKTHSSKHQYHSQDPVEAKVFAIAASTLGLSIEFLTLDAKQGETIGWDSFGHVNLALAIEENFNIKFSFNEVTSMLTLADIVAKVKIKLNHVLIAVH